MIEIQYAVHFGVGKSTKKELRVGCGPAADTAAADRQGPAGGADAGPGPSPRCAAPRRPGGKLRRAGPARPRLPSAITQVMTLLNLAPDIQEEILFLPRTERGHDPILERQSAPGREGHRLAQAAAAVEGAAGSKLKTLQKQPRPRRSHDAGCYRRYLSSSLASDEPPGRPARRCQRHRHKKRDHPFASCCCSNSATASDNLE